MSRGRLPLFIDQVLYRRLAAMADERGGSTQELCELAVRAYLEAQEVQVERTRSRCTVQGCTRLAVWRTGRCAAHEAAAT